MKKLTFIFGLSVLIVGTLFSQNFTLIKTGDLANDSSLVRSGAWADYNQDGYMDVFTAKRQLYHNNGDGTFTKMTGVGIDEDGQGVWGDYNNDGFPDLFIVNERDRNGLFLNNGNETFSKITTGEIVQDSIKSWVAYWVDYNLDSYLDVLVLVPTGNMPSNQYNHLYANNGNGTFTRITGINITDEVSESGGGCWGDYNNDGLPDLFLTNYGASNALYRNEGGGVFTKIYGDVVSDWWSTGAAWGDYNNDGYMDLFVMNLIENSLYKNNGDGSFTAITTGDIVNYYSSSVGCAWADFDNDGDLDLIVTNGHPQYNRTLLYSNNNDGTFTKITGTPIDSIPEGCGGGPAWADYDRDGDLDLLTTSYWTPNRFFRNDITGKNWINIKCVGVISNRDSYGAKVRIKAYIQGKYQWQMREINQTGKGTQSSPNAHFGLDNAIIIDSLTIEWPSGITCHFTNIDVNQFMVIDENCSIAGVKEDNLSQEVTIFPNPAESYLRIKSISGKVIEEVRIYNLTGQKIFEQSLLVEQLDVSFLKSGMYIIEMTSDKSVVRQKLIKQ
jgi:hypothetical protein